MHLLTCFHRRAGDRGLTRKLSLWAVVLAIAISARADVPVTDENVEDAIQRAVKWIWSQQRDGTWEHGHSSDRQRGGPTALMALALLYAGEDPRSADMAAVLDWVAAQELESTYAYGARAHALALVPGRKYRSRLDTDVAWLVKACGQRGKDGEGAYDYEAANDGRLRRWDNSNSQFGVLGVWMAAEAGVDISDSYWQLVEHHWLEHQNMDGSWGYRKNEPGTGSMTAAGLATMYVVLDQLYADRPKDASQVLSSISRGMNWLGLNYGPDIGSARKQWRYYYYYAVERVGRASGQKLFRGKDWFRTGAAYLLEEQQEDGSWSGSGDVMGALPNTAFALMFLCHGRAPLLMNKLQHGPDWDSKLRDVAGLSSYTTRIFERMLNWQIVSLDAGVDVLLEAPILYMRGRSRWIFDDVHVQRIREYCLRGGMVFAIVAEDGSGFRESVENLAQRAFPEYRLRPIGKDHPLFSGQVQFAIDDPPIIEHVDNGVRSLLLLCPADLGATWNKLEPRRGTASAFELGANVYLYATDKTTVRSRLETPNIPLEDRDIEDTIRLARIKYDGNWDPEPYGWTRMAHYLHNTCSIRLLVTSGVTLDSRDLQDVQVAHITGTDAFALSRGEIRGLRRFLTGGGTLLADAADGNRDFVESLEDVLRQALRGDLRTTPPDSPLLTGEGIDKAVDLSGAGLRRAARSLARGQKYPRLKVLSARRRYAAIYAPLDLSTGLLGTQAFNVKGYEPDAALRIVRNMILYAGLSPTEKAKLQRADD